jgi:hypothetical protein
MKSMIVIVFLAITVLLFFIILKSLIKYKYLKILVSISGILTFLLALVTLILPNQSLIHSPLKSSTTVKDEHKFYIFINVNPNRFGAKVYINNKPKGSAPCSILLEEGSYQIRLEYRDINLESYLFYNQTITIPPDTIIFIQSNEFVAK